MAIDPMLYQKMSGRSGDPYARLGEALSQQAARDSELNTAAYYDQIPERKAPRWWLWSVISSILVLGVLIWAFWPRHVA